MEEIKDQLKIVLKKNLRGLAMKHGYKDHQLGGCSIKNNKRWWGKYTLAEFMVQVAHNMRLGPMLGRERYPSLSFR
jgi:tyrosyl-tRNA synthetase